VRILERSRCVCWLLVLIVLVNLALCTRHSAIISHAFAKPSVIVSGGLKGSHFRRSEWSQSGGGSAIGDTTTMVTSQTTTTAPVVIIADKDNLSFNAWIYSSAPSERAGAVEDHECFVSGLMDSMTR